jgi:hypothetical protein
MPHPDARTFVQFEDGNSTDNRYALPPIKIWQSQNQRYGETIDKPNCQDLPNSPFQQIRLKLSTFRIHFKA